MPGFLQLSGRRAHVARRLHQRAEALGLLGKPAAAKLSQLAERSGDVDVVEVGELVGDQAKQARGVFLLGDEAVQIDGAPLGLGKIPRDGAPVGGVRRLRRLLLARGAGGGESAIELAVVAIIIALFVVARVEKLKAKFESCLSRFSFKR